MKNRKQNHFRLSEEEMKAARQVMRKFYRALRILAGSDAKKPIK